MLKQRFGKKGFTMAELLIVIAIIAILVAIALPVFGAQLNKAKHAVDVANARSLYSEAVANALLNTDDDQLDAVGTVSITIDVATAKTNNLLSDGCQIWSATNSHILNVTSFGRTTSINIDTDVTLNGLPTGTTGA